MIAVELRHLEYFVAVAAELNFSRAAKRIHVVQSALSASVSRLEKELGVELFDRSKRQITLTAPGEVFLEHAREVIHTAHRARTSVEGFRDQLAGTVTLGTLMSWGTLNLPAALEEFRGANPMVNVRIEGHTDSTGSPDFNQVLSQNRASAAAVALQTRGVSSNRITAVGKGQELPVATNATSAGRQQNRRVELVFSDNSGQFARAN